MRVLSWPEELEGVFVCTHPGAGGPEELPGEPVGDEAGGELVTFPRAAALTWPQTRPELLAEVRAADHELAAVLHLVTPQVGRGRALLVVALVLPRALNLRHR